MDVQVTNNEADARYEARLDGALAGFARYKLDDTRVVFTHTEVDPAFEGKGVGSALAKLALDDVRATGRTAVPRCSFIQGWIERHPAYQDLVA